MTIKSKMLTRSIVLTGAILVIGAVSAPLANAQEDYDRFIGPAPQTFTTPELTAEEFGKRLAADDKSGVIALLGLDPAAVAGVEDFDKRFAEIKTATAERIKLEEE